MKNGMQVVLLVLSIVPLAYPATAAQNASVQPKTAARRPSAPSKKTPKKQAAHKTKTGKATTGEAARQAKKETESGGDERDLRTDNRGRVSAAHHAKTHQQPSQVAKASHADKPTAAAANPRQTATVKQTAQSHPTAVFKTSQLTAGKTVPYHSKPASIQGGTRGNVNSKSKKTPDPAQSNQPSTLILKPNNARTF